MSRKRYNKLSGRLRKNQQCHIHDRVERYEVNGIRKDVCVTSLPLTEFTDGKKYCLFHLPTKEKNIADFERICKERLNSVNKKIIATEKLNKEKSEKILDELSYDFRYVWFPSETDLRNQEFAVFVNFYRATFSSSSFFSSTKFLAEAYFREVHFDNYAEFWSATFESDADFMYASFESNANFMMATFNGITNFIATIFFSDADFSLAKFLDNTDFSATTFIDYADFWSANFTETSQIFFAGTNLSSEADFQNAVFAGYISFEKQAKENVFIYPAELNKKIILNEEVSKKHFLNFQNSRLENPERITFHRFQLRPSFFVNTDPRKMIFTDVIWTNLEIRNNNSNIFAEINSLKKRGISEPNRLLEIATRQLAVNAEENNRYEEASNFRRMALELEWLERKEKILTWIKNLVTVREKLKRRFGGSTDEEVKPNPPTHSFGILCRSGDFIIHGLYRITSFYGESWSWAAFVLALIIFAIFPFIYTQTEFQVSPKTIPLQVVVKDCKYVVEELKSVCKIENRGLYFWSEAVPHSLATASLQTVEYRIPKTAWGSVWMILEKIFAPLQAALLALAIRRKFMR